MSKKVNVRLPSNLYEELQALADLNGRTLSAVIVERLEKFRSEQVIQESGNVEKAQALPDQARAICKRCKRELGLYQGRLTCINSQCVLFQAKVSG